MKILLIIPVIFLSSLCFAQNSIQEFGNLFRNGKTNEAKKGFESLKKKEASNDSLWYFLCRIAEREKKFDDATDYIEKAIKIKPNDSGYYLWLARCKGQEAQDASLFRQPFLAKDCKKAYLKSIELDKNNTIARVELISFHLQAPAIVGGSIDEAKVLAQEIEEINPYLGIHQQYRIAVNQKSTEIQEIIAKGKNQFPDSLSFHLNDFYEKVNTKNWEIAHQTLVDLQSRFQENQALIYQMGRLAALSGLFLDDGEKALITFISKTPDSENNPLKPHAYFRLGMIYEHLNDKAKAKESYQLAGDLKQAKEALKKLN